MSDIQIVRDYPHPPRKVWRALTEPELIARWGMRPEGFSTAVGTRFKFFGTPNRAWRGFIECELLEAREPTLLRYSWIDKDQGKPTIVSWALEPHAGGTRLRFQHTGFRGISGFLLAQLVMGPGHRKLLTHVLPALLANLDDAGNLLLDSSFKVKP
ncbi:MAG TPA: SRPBCC domain-containing protein [Polyangiaceae bacterium]|jgi:uncharacterized protein YndB with AHSA1/START domain|nr:SRPBCC domain-containing protein [Polyangiaceae bacterium]